MSLPIVAIRYQSGQLVKIRDVITSRYAGHTGRIVAVKPNKYGRVTLDKYIVLFPDGKQKEFWNIQLGLVAGNGRAD